MFQFLTRMVAAAFHDGIDEALAAQGCPPAVVVERRREVNARAAAAAEALAAARAQAADDAAAARLAARDGDDGEPAAALPLAAPAAMPAAAQVTGPDAESGWNYTDEFHRGLKARRDAGAPWAEVHAEARLGGYPFAQDTLQRAHRRWEGQ